LILNVMHPPWLPGLMVMQSQSSLSIHDPKEKEMDAIKGIAFALILAGVLALMYGGFSYTKETHQAKLGPIELSVTDKERVNIPVWAGIGAIVIGGALLVFGGTKR
jgi:hypothetical protein